MRPLTRKTSAGRSPGGRSARPSALALALPLLVACSDSTSPRRVATDIEVHSPLATWTVLQGFVWNAQWDGYHLANDLVAAAGDTVRAAADGVVGLSETNVSGYGALVLVEHETAGGDRFVTLYGHLSSRRGLLVGDGQQVHIGDPLATIADDDEDGGPWGPHLHFGIRPGPLDLATNRCGVWMYVGYTRSCSGITHDEWRATWIDPSTALAPGPAR